MKKTVPFVLLSLLAMLVPRTAHSQELPTGIGELRVRWQVESVEQRENPIEPQPVLADCMFDGIGIHVGDVYEATFAYPEPLVPVDQDETWAFGEAYPVRVQLGDVTVGARPGGFSGYPYLVTHYFWAVKSPIYGDRLSVRVLSLDLFDPLSAPSFSVILRDSSGSTIQVGNAIPMDPVRWETGSVASVWTPWDGSICQVKGSVLIDPMALIDALAGQVEGLGLPTGLATSLAIKLDGAIAILSDSQTNNDRAASSRLEAFINEVGAQTGKKISFADAANLTAAAEEILILLQGQPEPEYEMVELGTLGTSPFGYSFAQGINDNGQVVGYSKSDSGWHMFLWEDGDMVDLGVPGPGEPDFIWPRAINNKGQIVGEFRTSEITETAFIFDSGSWTLIKQEGVYWSDARDINSRGEVLGVEFGPYTGLRTFIWSEEGFDYLDIPGVSMHPQRMNDRDQVIALDFSGPMVGSILWDDGITIEILSPTGEMVEALDINDHGRVVGRLSASPGEGVRAFSWERGEMVVLPGMGGTSTTALAVNDKGLVVGSATVVDGRSHAVLWNDGTLTDLGTHPGQHHTSTGCTANDINGHGQVVGYCWTDYGPRAFLWDPKPTSVR